MSVRIRINDAAATHSIHIWREPDHPRRTGGAHAGQFAPKGQGGGGGASGAEPRSAPSRASVQPAAPIKPGVRATGLEAADRLKDQWAESSSIKTVDAVLQRAPKNQDALASAAKAIAEGSGAELVNPGVKSPDRIKQKLSRPGRKPQNLSDAVRLGFKVKTPEQANAVVRELAKQFEIADESWAVTNVGYFDRKVLVHFDDGMIGEVQLWEPEVHHVKETVGHHLYEAASKLPAGHPQIGELNAKQRAVYSQVTSGLPSAWANALSGSAGK